MKNKILFFISLIRFFWKSPGKMFTKKMKPEKIQHITLENLRQHRPQKDYFVSLDSDGTIFNSMQLKHKDCFLGALIRVFGLSSITHEVHLVWNYVNIYSNTRGTNRFKALILTFDYLRKFKRVQQLNIQLPPLKVLEEWVLSSQSLSNESLEQLVADLPKKEKKTIKTVLEWSEEINRMVKAAVFNLSPIGGSLKAMDFLNAYADLVVISGTPIDTLHREWSENNIKSKVLYIGGQETGTKTEMLIAVAKEKYAQDKILIIGDSPGDLIAAQSVNALFFPILQSKEEESWHNFNSEGCEFFLNGVYTGSYQNEQINQFKSSLDNTPPWLI